MSDTVLREQSELVVSLLSGLMRRLTALDSDDAALELPLAQMRVCGVLMDGTRTMGSLSRDLGISQSAMSQIADRLERAGMVERVLESDDRRCRSLRLTPLGIEKMRRRREGRLARALRVMNRLSPEDRTSIISALELLTRAGLAEPAEQFDPMEHPELVEEPERLAS